MMPVCFRHRDENHGRDVAARRMRPAQQRLDADDLRAFRRDDRLVMHFERVLIERALELAFEEAPLVEIGLHRGLECDDMAAAGALGRAHGEGRMAKQIVARSRRRAAHRSRRYWL